MPGKGLRLCPWAPGWLQAGELSEFALNSSLDAAVRASNAQYDAPDVLERLRVRLPRGSAFETGEAARALSKSRSPRTRQSELRSLALFVPQRFRSLQVPIPCSL